MGKSNIRFRDAKDLYFVDESEVLTVECSLAKGSIGVSLAIDEHPSLNLTIDLYDGLATIPIGDILRAAGQRNRSNPCYITITATCDGASVTTIARCVFCRRFSDDESVIFSSWLCSCGSQKVTYRSAPEILPFLADPSAATQSALIRISFLDGTSSDYTFADLRNMTVDGLDVSPKAVAEFASGKGVKKEIVSYDLWIIRESSSGARTTGKPCSFKIAKDRIERVTYKFLNQKGAFEYIHASGELRRSIDARTKTFISPGSESELSNDSSVIMEQNAGHIGSRSGAAAWLDFLSSSRRYVVDKSMAEHLIVVEDNKSETLDFGVGEISFRWHYGDKSASRADSAIVPLESLRQRCESVINTPLNRVRIDVDYEPSYTNQRGVIWRIVDGGEFVSLNSDGILRVKEGAHGSRVTILAQSVHDGSITDLKSYTVSYNTQAPSYPMTIETNVESPVVDLIIDDSEVDYEDGILIREGQLVTLRVSKPGYNTQSRSFEFSATEKSQYFYLVRHFQSDDYVSESTVKALISEGLSSLDWFIPESYEEDGETKYRLKLNPKYVGMYAEGWVSAGGVSEQGGGGGGTGYLRDLLDVNASMSPTEGQALVWDDALGKWTAGDVSVDLTPFERIANRVTTVSSSSNHTQYPTAKAVYDIVNTMLSSVLRSQGITTTPITNGSTTNPIIIDGKGSYTASEGDVVIRDDLGLEFMWTGGKWRQFGDESSYALKTVTITGSGYLTGGGNLEAARTIDIADAVKTKIDNGATAFGYFTDGAANEAIKLKTPRSIWGQSFDGSANVSGAMTGVTTVNSFINAERGDSNAAYLFLTNVYAPVDYAHIFVSNQDKSTTHRPLVLQNGYGNVGVGISSPAYKLDVSGDSRTSGKVYIGTSGGYLEVVNVGTTASPVYALKSSLPFYSDSWVSAGGVSPAGSGGGSTGYLKDLLDVNGSMIPVDGQALVWDSSLGDNGKWTSKNVSVDLTPFERTTNKVTSISASSTDGQYPSARAVYNAMGNYLPLAGGTITGPLTIQTPWDSKLIFNNTDGEAYTKLSFREDNTEYGSILINSEGFFYDLNKVWHAGNDGSDSGLDADLLDGLDSDRFLRTFNDSSSDISTFQTPGVVRISVDNPGKPSNYYNYGNVLVVRGNGSDTLAQLVFSYSQNGLMAVRSGTTTNIGDKPWRTLACKDDNVASATKLETARTIWGQSFDGTGNVNGDLYLSSNTATTNSNSDVLRFNGYIDKTYITGPSLRSINVASYGRARLAVFQHNSGDYTGEYEALSILPNGNVGFGTNTPAYKADIVGDSRTSGKVYIGTSGGYLEVVNVGTTASPVYALKSSLPFYSDSWVSAGGVSPAGSGGGITGYLKDLLDVNGSMIPEDGQALFWDSSLGDTGKWTSKNVSIDLTPFERTTNKVTSISASSTDGQYPSAKAVYSALSTKADSSALSGYLPLTGGTLNSGSSSPTLTLNTSAADSAIKCQRGGLDKAWIGYNTGTGVYLYNSTRAKYLNYKDDGSLLFENNKVWHAGNDGSGSGLDADYLDGKDGAYYMQNLPTNSLASAGCGYLYVSSGKDAGFPFIYGVGLQWGNSVTYAPASGENHNQWYQMLFGTTNGNLFHSYSTNGAAWDSWKQIAFTNSNVASATKLETARTIWGQSFDGTGNVSGLLTSVTGIHMTGNLMLGSGEVGPYLNKNGVSIHNASNAWAADALKFDASGNAAFYHNVGIGTTSPGAPFHVHGPSGEVARISQVSNYTAGSGPELSFYNSGSEKLASVRGVFDRASGQYGNLLLGTRTSDAAGVTTKMTILYNGNVGVGTPSPAYKLDVAGTVNINPFEAAVPAIRIVASGNSANHGINYVDASGNIKARFGVNSSTGLFQIFANGDVTMRSGGTSTSGFTISSPATSGGVTSYMMYPAISGTISLNSAGAFSALGNGADLASPGTSMRSVSTKIIYLAQGIYIYYDTVNNCIRTNAPIVSDSYISAGGISTTSN